MLQLISPESQWKSRRKSVTDPSQVYVNDMVIAVFYP